MTTSTDATRSLEALNRPAAQSRHAHHDDAIRWWRVAPSLLIHLGCLGVIWVGWSPVAVGVAALLYFARMFAITAFYHRYFSHRTFRTSRIAHFLFGFLGASSAQRGPIWWAAHHREHHRESDAPPDIHSPVQHGMLWSHMGWFFSDGGVQTPEKAVPDLLKMPEVRWLDRFHIVAVLALAVCCYGLGVAIDALAPSWGTSGVQMLVWGFFISTTVLHHATFTLNSLAHTIGSRRYQTRDDSRNSLVLAVLTLGEGWHNNHHFNPGSVRQGFFWWEIDVAYYCLWMLERLGVVWDLRPVPKRAFDAAGRTASP